MVPSKRSDLEKRLDKALQELREGRSEENSPYFRGLDERERYREQTAVIKQERELQRGVARWVMWVVSLWLLFIAGLLAFVGMSRLDYSYSVLIALLATTTTNIIGLAYFMAKGLFPNK